MLALAIRTVDEGGGGLAGEDGGRALRRERALLHQQHAHKPGGQKTCQE